MTGSIETDASRRDWLRSPRTSLLAWWVPHAAIVAGLFVPVPVRAAIWTIALIWMGMACILNARQCGRTHCRYTGPYYLAMIVPVLLLAAGMGLRRSFRLADPRRPHSCRRQTHLVGHRTRLGKILTVGRSISFGLVAEIGSSLSLANTSIANRFCDTWKPRDEPALDSCF
jgi:hypothetical protein